MMVVVMMEADVPVSMVVGVRPEVDIAHIAL